MKVETDPLQIAETNFAEPVDINVLDAIEVEAGQLDVDKISEDTQGPKTVEGLMGQEEGNAADGNAKVAGEVKTAEGLMGQEEGNAADGNAKIASEAKTIEGLKVRFEELEIAEGPKFKINMVNLNQLSPEMAEIERRLKMEDDRVRTGHQKVSLVEYLFHCHTKNPGRLVCPRCSAKNDRSAVMAYQKVYQGRDGNSWRNARELLPYPKMGENLMDFWLGVIRQDQKF